MTEALATGDVKPDAVLKAIVAGREKRLSGTSRLASTRCGPRPRSSTCMSTAWRPRPARACSR
ncbi:MAG: hypothetical protein MZW92_70885 [Comamonadaceae bacterium]|nr:hypothetical protein [Comamonadaceae bacterium]